MNVAEKLTNAGIKPSIQRMQIYEFLLENPVHPTVETVYNALYKSMPTLSKTTVYNTLKLLEEKNLVQTITIEDSELRFDANVNEHIHFKCVKCKKIFDIFEITTTPSLPDGFLKLKKQTNIWGTCPDCKI